MDRFDAELEARLPALSAADVLLFGEQHDAADHHLLEERLTTRLGARNQLAALVIEMAESGRDTHQVSRAADEATVREALGWTGANWPWADYGPMIMAAVRAGVPVRGANLPRTRMREAMGDTRLDSRLDAQALSQQRRAIEDGHCGLLPATQIAPMTRIQLARDISMASTIASAVQPGRVVLFVAGSGHVARDIGVPRHLPPHLRTTVLMAAAGAEETTVDGLLASRADQVWRTPATPAKDHCGELRRRLQRP